MVTTPWSENFPLFQTHSFHSSGWGWNNKSPTWNRRSLLMGSSRGGPSRRDIKSGNHTLPGHHGEMRSSRTWSRWTLSRTTGSRAIWRNAYRQSLGHICTIASGPRGAGCVSEYQSGQWDVSRDANRSTRASISAPPPRGGVSIPQASAPVSTGCLLLYCGPPGCKLLEETTTSLGTTGGFGTPVWKMDMTATPPGDISRTPPKCCLGG